MRSALRHLACDESGATLVEYALVVGLISGVAIAVLTSIGGSIVGIFTAVGSVIKAPGP